MRRRHFLAAGLGFSAWALKPASVGAIEPISRPGKPRLKLSLAAYSLRDQLQAAPGSPGAIDLIGFIDYCAKLGIEGAELTSYYFPAEINAQYINALKRHAHLLGLSISGGAIRNDFCQSPGEKLDADMTHLSQWVDHYSNLGAPVIRVFAGNVPNGEGEDAAIARCIEAMEKACEIAGKRGVMLALENHGGITASAATMLKIVEGVKSPWFGVNFDSGNFHAEDPYAELAKIAPYAINAQIKTEMSVGGNKSPADLTRIVKILRDAGYAGWITLEYEAAENPYDAIPKHIETLKGVLTAS